MSNRRIFVTGTAVVAVLIVVFVSGSLLGIGGNAFEDSIHTAAEIAAPLFVIAIALLIATRWRGRNRGLGDALIHQAAHDALTGLPNRTLLLRRIEHDLDGLGSDANAVTLIMLDLDGFKEVNDTFGHSTGDLVLIQVAQRVLKRVRDDDTVARLGGDEFAVLLSHGPGDHVAVLARRVLSALELPMTIGGITVSVAASVGTATAGHGESAEELLRNADLAMYAAKAAGGNCFAPYKPSMHTAIAERVRVENGLRTAWLTGDLLVHYQPIVDLANGRMVSIEALARWKHPDGDVIPPDVFIPIAERTGLIIPIGARILNEACQQLARWQQEYGAAADVTMSVNVSPRQLYSDDLVDDRRGGDSQRRHRTAISHPRGHRDRDHGRHGQCDPDPQPAQGTRRWHGDR